MNISLLKKFAVIIGVILAVFLFAALVAGTGEKQKNEVIFWTLQMSDFSEFMNGVINRFEAENPDIKIKWIDVPFSEGEKRTLASVLSDKP